MNKKPILLAAERDIWVGYTFKSLDIAADGLLLLTQGRFAVSN